MKRIAVALVMLLLLAGIAIAALSGGTAGDPLISLSYLNNTYLPELTEKLAGQIAAGTEAAYTAADARLDGIVNDHLQGTDGLTEYSAAFRTHTTAREDEAELAEGSSLLVRAGRARLEEGHLLDVTAGAVTMPGATLQVGRRYLAIEGTATVSSVSEAAWLAVQGSYAIQMSGADALPFTDIMNTDWFYESVSLVYARALMSGVGEGQFGVAQSTTRAMLATVLHRMSGAEAAGTHSFTDVAPGAWYAQAVAWAVNSGVVQGMGGNLFAPEGAITREQMAVMLGRYAGDHLKLDVSASADLTTFSDGAQVSVWAVDGMRWAVTAGIITGRPDGTLDPGGTATRVEVAAMLARFAAWMER